MDWTVLALPWKGCVEVSHVCGCLTHHFFGVMEAQLVMLSGIRVSDRHAVSPMWSSLPVFVDGLIRDFVLT